MLQRAVLCDVALRGGTELRGGTALMQFVVWNVVWRSLQELGTAGPCFEERCHSHVQLIEKHLN